MTMLNSSNYISLIFLAVTSWILLCVFNWKPSPHEKYLHEKEETQKNQVLQWPESVMHSVTSVDPSVMIYIACTLCGALVIVNFLKRKMNAIVQSEAIDNTGDRTKVQVKILKLQKRNLLKLIRDHKLQMKLLMQNDSTNKIIIRKLKHELRNTKTLQDNYMLCNTSNGYRTLQKVGKDKAWSIKQNKMCTSSSGIVNNYFNRQITTVSKRLDNYGELELTTSNIEVINGILREAYCGGQQVRYPTTNETISNERSVVRNGMRKAQHIVNIVSTDQLAYMKGLY